MSDARILAAVLAEVILTEQQLRRREIAVGEACERLKTITRGAFAAKKANEEVQHGRN